MALGFRKSKDWFRLPFGIWVRFSRWPCQRAYLWRGPRKRFGFTRRQFDVTLHLGLGDVTIDAWSGR